MTLRQQRAIEDFIRVAQTNGLHNLWAALPRAHALVRTNQVAQIRLTRTVLASGVDELGNSITLGTDLRVTQS